MATASFLKLSKHIVWTGCFSFSFYHIVVAVLNIPFSTFNSDRGFPSDFVHLMRLTIRAGEAPLSDMIGVPFQYWAQILSFKNRRLF